VTVSAWAEVLTTSLSPSQILALQSDPAEAMRSQFNLRVRKTKAPPQRGEAGTCDGLSILSQGLVLYVDTASRRRNFTLLHELGHHLADQCEELLIWAADQPDTGRVLEEICDRFAATLLIPETLASDVVGAGPVKAKHLADLFQRSIASREVCAIALCRFLGCQGFVAILDREAWQVTFAARQIDTRPYPWRGDIVPTGHPLRKLGAGGTLRCTGWWAFADGEQVDYWFDSVSDQRYAYAVFASTDLWEVSPFHGYTVPAERPTAQRFSFSCSACARSGQTYAYPCSTCGQPPCDKCGKCECDRRRDRARVCSRCRISVEPHLLKQGLCVDCRAQLRPG